MAARQRRRRGRTGQRNDARGTGARGSDVRGTAADRGNTERRRGRRTVIALAVVGVAAVSLTVPPVRTAAETSTGWMADQVLARMPASDVGAVLDHLPERNRILAADGSPLAQTWWQNREVVPTDAIAPVMRHAQVAIEDARFYDHGSVDPTGLMRALVANVTAGDATGQGASTIEQQLAKNLAQLQAQLDGAGSAVAASTDKTVSRKLDDMVLAAHLDQSLSKDQILTDYLNVVYYGGGAYGVQAAAERYFGTTAARLTLPQAALLAGLVQAPSAYDPLAHPQAATARRGEVITAMQGQGLISRAAARAANAAPLGLRPVTPVQGCTASSAPQFCAFAVRRVLASSALAPTAAERERIWREGGLTLTTTLDPTVQRATAAGIAGQSLPNASLRAAAAVVRPGTGAVLALGQDSSSGASDASGASGAAGSLSVDVRDGGLGAFQAGSTFKTFTLAAAYAGGYQPDSVINAPASGTAMQPGDFQSCEPVGGAAWAPKNAPGDPSGPMTLRTALGKSVNTAFVALEAKVGLCQVRDVARSLGVTQSDGTPLQPLPSLTLGTSTTSPLTMAGAYAAFAADGRYCAPTPLASLTGAGRSVTFAPECRQGVDASVAGQVRDTMHAVVQSGTGAAANIPGVDVAGKTGTTDTSSSTWFTGITPRLAASVWVGDPRGGTYRHLYGGDVAAPLWKRIVQPVAWA